MTLQTEDVIAILKEDNRIILNCTYQEELKVEISNRDIRWRKLIGGELKNIAVFSPPGGQDPFIPKDMEPLYINRTELIAPNTSLSAVMIIKNPVCSDEGIYQCWIQYFSDEVLKTQTSRSFVEFECKYTFMIYARYNTIRTIKINLQSRSDIEFNSKIQYL